jgi:cytochrome P450
MHQGRRDPDRFDVVQDAADHLTFGTGLHHCLGPQPAQVELQEAFRGLIGRLLGLRLAVPASDLEFKPRIAIHSLHELPVLWGKP